jgi:maltooligosyltrehalose trehalohydrolase
MDAEIIEKKQAVRRMPFGAEPGAEGVHFRLWAPSRHRVDVVLESGASRHALHNEGNGYFSGFVAAAGPGTAYRFSVDGGPLLPDPASRYQPEGPHGPSVVVDLAFPWTDRKWTGLAPEDHILYEMHVGSFTPEGTWAAAEKQLPALRDLGITTIEMMPLADFTGRFGWGYDGVNLFAPAHIYGRPEDLKRFVNRAHDLGMAVILDVVYNHLGVDGNYLGQITPDYLGSRYSEWGQGFNFDGANNAPVRRFVSANAAYWIDEFHFDGLRLDATQQIFDDSPRHIMADIAAAARAAAPARRLFLVAENEPQDARLIRAAEEGGYGLDALYNDDFHHSALVAVTGRREAYYMDYFGAPQELVSLARRGFLYQGQYDKWQRQRRGKPALDRSLRQFIIGIENHDQVANSGTGRRVHQLTSPGRFRALTALMLLQPQIPMLFQGQEFSASAPFYYFADHTGGLAEAVREGRMKFLRQFPSAATPEMQNRLLDPESAETFKKTKIDLSERDSHSASFLLHKDLIRLRREDAAFRHAKEIDGAVMGPEAFVLRYLNGGDDRLLLVNFGQELPLHPAPEPLLAPPAGRRWELVWSSEDPRYGGAGTPECETPTGWRLPAQSALALKAAKA